jgi:hypothetical protein
MEMPMAKKICLMLMMIGLIAGCGKKGPLILEPDLMPQEVENLKLLQVGQFIQLQWDFKEKLLGKSKDKSKTEFLLENVRDVHIYYSTKEILGGKFRKKAKLIKKLKPGDLTVVRDERLSLIEKANRAKKTRQTGRTSIFAKDKEEKHYTYSIKIPLQIKELGNKLHYVAVQYYYQKKRSPISKVAFIRTMIPVLPVTDLTVKRENKLVTLKWKRPQTDAAGNTAANFAGYNVFRKIEPFKQEQEPGQESQISPGSQPYFKQVNNANVLTEYFEDNDTGTNGSYSYYVSAIITKDIESAPSKQVTIRVSDVYPPEIPANLVCFKAVDHLYLSWRDVTDKDFSHYRLYRRTSTSSEFNLIADKLSDTRFKDTTVRKGRTYIYAVTAVDMKGNESEYSNEASEKY